jgi:hypothetical protein
MLPLTTAIRKVERLAYSPDGTRLAAGGPMGTEVLDLASGDTVALQDDLAGGQAVFLPTGDGLLAAVTGNAVRVRYFDGRGDLLRSERANRFPLCVGLMSGSDHWFEAVEGQLCHCHLPTADDQTWRKWIWYLDQPNFLTHTIVGFGSSLRVAALLSRDSASAERRVSYLYLLDATTGTVIRRHRCGYRALDHFTGSPCGQWLVGVKQNSLVIWDTDRLGWPPRRLLNDTPKQFTGVAFVPDGRHLLTTSNDKAVKAWDLAAGQVVRSYDFAVGRTRSVAVAPDGLTAAAGSDESLVVLFDLDL